MQWTALVVEQNQEKTELVKREIWRNHPKQHRDQEIRNVKQTNKYGIEYKMETYKKVLPGISEGGIKRLKVSETYKIP